MENTYLIILKGGKSLRWSARSWSEAKSEVVRLRGINTEDIEEIFRKVEN